MPDRRGKVKLTGGEKSMKRIEYTAAGIRLVGVYLAVTLLAQSFDISASLSTQVYSNFPGPVLHVLGVPVMDGRAGAFFLACGKLAAAVAMTFNALRLAKLFWMGILPEVPENLRSVLGHKKPAGDDADSDPWSDSV